MGRLRNFSTSDAKILIQYTVPIFDDGNLPSLINLYTVDRLTFSLAAT